ncbi:MAG: hypothetical protein CMQ28_06945 [Gammaproteobacteria bacterium]|nr:hypothetical protein [Gammaproteobacteria bacterium]MED5411446.1 hypothetical protein [Pseudomonadota bacterium]|tara:strand:+ start:765 stop:1232 length:468 start_codon:yes stop_codon:yes gene_type:complete
MNRTKKIVLIFICSHILASGTLKAQSHDEDAQAISSAMSALDEFMAAFNSRNMEAWAATLNYPHVRFASGDVTVWENAEEFKREATFERLPRTGWDHSHWLEREAILVSPGKIHINTVFQRFNDKNEPIGTYESLYIVTQVAGHWGTQARSSLAP